MSEKKIDRLYIDKKNIEDYDRLKEKDSPFSGLQNKDLFMAAMVVGFNEGIRSPLKNKSGFVREEYLSEKEKILIKSIAIHEENGLEALLNKEKIFIIAEEYANGGIELLKKKVLGGEYGSYAKKIEHELLNKYKEIETTDNEIKTLQPSGGINVEEIIMQGESNLIEFKSSMIYDYLEKRKNKELSFIIAKTLSSFMNSKGGHLIIGIRDDKEILGIEEDYKFVINNNKDGYELYLTDITNNSLGKIARQYFDISFHNIRQKEVAIIRVVKAQRPIYFKNKGMSEFYIRSGNRCQPLDVQDANLYIKEHWPQF